MPKQMIENELAGRTADAVTLATAVAFGTTQWAELDHIISAIAGVLVAISASLSIYLHLQRIKKDKKDN